MAEAHKVSLCGKGDVGKTSLFLRIRDDTFSEDTKQTNEGVQNCNVTVKNSEGKSVQVIRYNFVFQLFQISISQGRKEGRAFIYAYS